MNNNFGMSELEKEVFLAHGEDDIALVLSGLLLRIVRKAYIQVDHMQGLPWSVDAQHFHHWFFSTMLTKFPKTTDINGQPINSKRLQRWFLRVRHQPFVAWRHEPLPPRVLQAARN